MFPLRCRGRLPHQFRNCIFKVTPHNMTSPSPYCLLLILREQEVFLFHLFYSIILFFVGMC